jgi:hypothetical protein
MVWSTMPQRAVVVVIVWYLALQLHIRTISAYFEEVFHFVDIDGIMEGYGYGV